MNLKDFAVALSAAVDAVENKAATEEQVKWLENRRSQARSDLEQAKAAAVKVKNDADAHVLKRHVDAAQIQKELDEAHEAHKVRQQAVVENSNQQVQASADTLTGLQAQIRDSRAELEALNLQTSKMRAAFDEAASKLS